VRLWLIRHFEPDVVPGVCYGQTDLMLRDCIETQSNRLAALRVQLSTLAPAQTVLFSSPLRRCADIAATLSDKVVVDDRLRELHFGEWEMQNWDAIGGARLDDWANDIAGFRPPGGETGYEVQQRALHWLQETATHRDTAIVVTHAGVMRALQAHQQRLPGARWLELRYDYGQLLTLEFTSEQIFAAPVQ
jgi:alpha-ribazole phosphatase